MNDRLCIGIARRTVGGFAAFFGAMTALGVSRGLAAHSLVNLAGAVVLIGGPFLFYASLTLRQRPLLVLDHDGLEDGRSGRVVRWCDVEYTYVHRRQGSYGEFHHLVLTTRPATQDGSADPGGGASAAGPPPEDDRGRPLDRHAVAQVGARGRAGRAAARPSGARPPRPRAFAWASPVDQVIAPPPFQGEGPQTQLPGVHADWTVDFES